MGRGDSGAHELLDLDDVVRGIDDDLISTPRDVAMRAHSDFVKALTARLEADPEIDEIDDPDGHIQALVNDDYQPNWEIDQLEKVIRLRIFERGEEDLNDFLVHRSGAFGGIVVGDGLVSLADSYEVTIYNRIMIELGKGERKLSAIGQRVRRNAHHELISLGSNILGGATADELMERLFGNIPKTICNSTEDEIRIVLKQMRDSVEANYGATSGFLRYDLPNKVFLERHFDAAHFDPFDRATLIGILMNECWQDTIADLEGAHLPASPFHNRLRKMVGLYEME